ncbi:SDR family NAD(P)-dependent oxidoreductase [Actomonas aquatica]|uniref:SDR family NAD(P)-dependent oxidoreductase n=1 Tax=Actomonas aquatica TaxID=2866162 RepID=A0ABZ1C8L2_9BACT|nr:SDR family NAD(P)-dependent oxidoreductase [Opitutus sp. WL0086]WRQ88031.1 SDR family NAD(P)-dependent oxidoreductase [Opitutus sp. WL0086]
MPVVEKQHLPYAAVVLTGGSSGIGKSFVSHIAKVDPEVLICNLSRRKPDVNSAQLKLCHVEVDLSDNRSRSDGLERLLEVLAQKAPSGPILLINNAGFGHYGAFSSADSERYQAMVELNVGAVMAVTAALLPLLRERGGAIMNVASVVAFQPTPLMATYGATKAFVLHWSHALRAELAPVGVEVMAVCPGSTQSAFHDEAGMSRGSMGDAFTQTADQVVEEAMRALRRGKAHVVTGWLNKVQCWLSARLPLTWSTWASHRVLEKYRPKA